MKYLLILFLLIKASVFSQSELKHEVYFNTDEYEVPLIEENRLLLFISSLDTVAIDKISIYGFCDDRGPNDYNQKLSQNRANMIKNKFSNYGIDQKLITNVNGKGEILLKFLNNDEVNRIRGLNRKVEIIVELQKDRKTQEEKVTEVYNKNTKITTKDLAEGRIKKGDKIRLDKIYFKTNYSYITPDSKATLEDLAKILVAKKNIYFTIQGHVCCTQNGRDAIDKKTKKRNLSVARAKYIYDYLTSKGVDKKRMKYVGMRRKFPLGGDPKYDRRVELLITYISEED